VVFFFGRVLKTPALRREFSFHKMLCRATAAAGRASKSSDAERIAVEYQESTSKILIV
jgi:hypothetical protein